MGNSNESAREQRQRQRQTSVARIGSSVTLAVSMTNEELAVQIQQGRIEYYGELWERCRRLLYALLRRRLKGMKLPNYIAPEDMVQEMYFALCKAVQAYDGAKPYSFNSYLSYSVMNAVRESVPDAPFAESSCNQTAKGDDGEETELLDFMEDETAAAAFRSIELTDLQRQVRQAVAALPNREQQAVALYYFKGLTYKQIAAIDGVSVEMIRARKNKGINLLRRSKALRALYGELRSHYFHTGRRYL